jgi:hypothetical protein
MENCLSKAKFTSAEGCAGARAQQAQGTGGLSSFIPDAVDSAPLLGLVKLSFTICS